MDWRAKNCCRFSNKPGPSFLEHVPVTWMGVPATDWPIPVFATHLRVFTAVHDRSRSVKHAADFLASNYAVRLNSCSVKQRNLRRRRHGKNNARPGKIDLPIGAFKRDQEGRGKCYHCIAYRMLKSGQG